MSITILRIDMLFWCGEATEMHEACYFPYIILGILDFDEASYHSSHG